MPNGSLGIQVRYEGSNMFGDIHRVQFDKPFPESEHWPIVIERPVGPEQISVQGLLRGLHAAGRIDNAFAHREGAVTLIGTEIKIKPELVERLRPALTQVFDLTHDAEIVVEHTVSAF